MNRYFFGLWPDAMVRKALIKQRTQLNCTGRLTADANLHLTLLFLGQLNINQLARVIEAAETVNGPSFDLCIDQTGFFKHNRIFWLGPETIPEPLLQLYQNLLDVAQQCHIAIKPQAYKPHITLSKKGRYEKVRKIPPLLWSIQEFVLLKSIDTRSGVHYEKVKYFTFKNDGN